jgi:hypothetical protein
MKSATARATWPKSTVTEDVSAGRGSDEEELSELDDDWDHAVLAKIQAAAVAAEASATRRIRIELMREPKCICSPKQVTKNRTSKSMFVLLRGYERAVYSWQY